VAGRTSRVVALSFIANFFNNLPNSSNSLAGYLIKSGNISSRSFSLLPLAVKRLLTVPDPSLISTRVHIRRISFVMSSSNVAFGDDEFSKEGNDTKNNGLPDGVVHNVLNHLTGNEIIILFLRSAL